jgi:GT2 family glycosyltransferase
MITTPNTANSRSLPRLTVIIVAYNGASDLARCLPSVLAASQTNHQRRIVVVDNASSDSSADIVASFTDVEIIRLAENRGFTGGNNVALQSSLDRGDEYAVLLNQDTVVEPGWLDELVCVAESNPDAGAVQSLLTLYPDVDTVNSWGNEQHYLGLGFAGGNGRPITEAPKDTCEISYPSGAAVLLRVSCLRRVGLLNQDLYMYHEDLALGWMMRLAGWRVLLDPASVVHHAYSFSKSIQKFYFMERNRWLVLLGYWRWGTVLALLPMLLVMEIGQLIFSAKNGFFRRRLGLYAELFSRTSWQTIGRMRHEVCRLRTVGDRAILRRTVATIRYQELMSPLLALANPVMAAYRWLILLVVWW